MFKTCAPPVKYLMKYIVLNQIQGLQFFNLFIITMTKVLGADWLRSVRLFHELYSNTVNDFAKTNKMAESYLNTKKIAPEDLKQKD